MAFNGRRKRGKTDTRRKNYCKRKRTVQKNRYAEKEKNMAFDGRRKRGKTDKPRTKKITASVRAGLKNTNTPRAGEISPRCFPV